MISEFQLLLVYSYGLPLFLLNLRTVYVLWTKKSQFSSAYFRLFLLCGCNDILLYVSNNLITRLPSYEPLFDKLYSKFENQWWPGLGLFGIMFCSHFTHFGVFFLCLNRLTAILYYISYEKVSYLDLNNT